MSVFTEKFLQDLGITQLEQIVGYTVGAQVETRDDNAVPTANASINGQTLVRGIAIRGISATQAIDFFKSTPPNDSYRVGRLDESRGPNGILFGISSAGGLINQSSILATTNRDSGRFSYQVGSGASSGDRFEFRATR